MAVAAIGLLAQMIGCRPEAERVELVEDGSKDYHVVVVGQTASMLVDSEQRLTPMIRRINAAMPDFVIVLGGVCDPAWIADADPNDTLDQTKQRYDGLRMPRFYVPGVDAATPAARRRAWEKRIGPLWQSWTYKANRFVTLCPESSTPGRRFSQEQVSFLEKQVARLGKQDRLYVLVAEPLWEADTQGEPNEWDRRIHPVLAKAGGATVIAGRWNQFIDYPNRDGVRYICAGGSGMEFGLLRGRPFLGPVLDFQALHGAGGHHRIDLPRVRGIKLDGQNNDWEKRGMAITRLTAVRGAPVNAADCQCRARLGWDERGVLVMAEVLDDVVLVELTEADTRVPLSRRDALRLVASAVGDRGDWHSLSAAPSMRDGSVTLQQSIRRSGQKDWQAVGAKAQGHCQLARNGYVMELLLPWETLGTTGEAGASLGLQLVLFDADGQGAAGLFTWQPFPSEAEEIDQLIRVRLVDAKGPRLSPLAGERLFVEGRIMAHGRVMAELIGSADLAGSPVVVLSGLNSVARGRMLLEGGQARCTLIFCRPIGPSADQPLEIYLGDERVQSFKPQ